MSLDGSYENRHKNINLQDKSMILFLKSKRRIYIEVNVIYNRIKIDIYVLVKVFVALKISFTSLRQ